MARRSRGKPQPGAHGSGERARGNAAEFVGAPRTLPRSLVAGRQYVVAITMRNSGASVWRADGGQPYRLGAQHPQDTTQWGLGRIDVPTDVHPGSETTFIFTVVAPESPGRYHFQWRMVQDGVGWFGEASDDTVVRVDRAASPVPRNASVQLRATPVAAAHRTTARRGRQQPGRRADAVHVQHGVAQMGKSSAKPTD